MSSTCAREKAVRCLDARRPSDGMRRAPWKRAARTWTRPDRCQFHMLLRLDGATNGNGTMDAKNGISRQKGGHS